MLWSFLLLPFWHAHMSRSNVILGTSWYAAEVNQVTFTKICSPFISSSRSISSVPAASVNTLASYKNKIYTNCSLFNNNNFASCKESIKGVQFVFASYLLIISYAHLESREINIMNVILVSNKTCPARLLGDKML